MTAAPTIGLALIVKDEERSYPDISSDFGHWLAGFIDGEGSFIVNYKRNAGSYACHFMLGIRSDDRPILEEIVRRTGLGVIYDRPAIDRSKPRSLWRVFRRDDVAQLVELLDRHPLRAKKAKDFAIWREAVIEWLRIPSNGRSRDWSRLAEYRRELRAARVYRGTP